MKLPSLDRRANVSIHRCSWEGKLGKSGNFKMTKMVADFVFLAFKSTFEEFRPFEIRKKLSILNPPFSYLLQRNKLQDQFSVSYNCNERKWEWRGLVFCDKNRKHQPLHQTFSVNTRGWVITYKPWLGVYITFDQNDKTSRPLRKGYFFFILQKKSTPIDFCLFFSTSYDLVE